jgi:hypothetical protein
MFRPVDPEGTEAAVRTFQWSMPLVLDTLDVAAIWGQPVSPKRTCLPCRAIRL